MKAKNPLILIIRDGWGHNLKIAGNFIKAAKTPNNDFYQKKYPHNLLLTSGEAVGLEHGYQGNSEVGHLTMGSGRVIFQSLTRINKAIKDGSFFKNQVFLEAIKKCRQNKTSLHLLGLLQTEGVHAHLNHLLSFLDLCQKEKFHDVYLHVITDGRDAPPTSSLKHLNVLEKKLKDIGFGKIMTISGRYFAMDRDKRWARTKKAYQAIALGVGKEFISPKEAIKDCHKRGETDEFIEPLKHRDYPGIKPGDTLVFLNFRTDRTRQLTQALVEKNFSGFKRKYFSLNFVAMTEYYSSLKTPIAFPSISLNNLLGEVVSKAGFKQLRISETEKYAHVTFFFNGQKEKANPGEDRILIPSPKVATYDKKPEMSAFKIADRLVKEINKSIYDFIVVNLVNCDMVGHTAVKKAIIQAVNAVDIAQGKIIKAALENNYTCLVLADHGNAEDKTALTSTSHTTNSVPVILVSNDSKLKEAKIKLGAGLKDVAPTILQILGLKKPKEMTGQSFIIKK